MSEETTTPRRRRRSTPAPEENGAAQRGPTKRVVLRREFVLTIPEGTPAEKVEQAAKLLGLKGKITHGATAWLVVGEFEGDSKDRAIEAHAGKANTPDAKPGAYKAPTASAWAGGLLYERPPEPKVERKALD